MTPTELREAGERLYGPDWRQPLAALFQINRATLRRWISVKGRVPRPVALAVTLMLEKAETSCSL
jgi:hypothetical protein